MGKRGPLPKAKLPPGYACYSLRPGGGIVEGSAPVRNAAQTQQQPPQGIALVVPPAGGVEQDQEQGTQPGDNQPAAAQGRGGRKRASEEVDEAQRAKMRQYEENRKWRPEWQHRAPFVQPVADGSEVTCLPCTATKLARVP